MQINFNSKPKNIVGVEEFAKEELSRLEKFSSKIEMADIYYSKTGDVVDTEAVEIKLSVPGPDVLAKAVAENYSKAFALCVDKLEQQMKKRPSYHHNRK